MQQGLYEQHFEESLTRISEGDYLPNIDAVETLRKMIVFCKEKEVTPVLLTMPSDIGYIGKMPTGLTDAVDKTLQDIADEYRINYYRYFADSRFAPDRDLFEDSVHLNKQGAVKFTTTLFLEVDELQPFLAQ
jgi:hypothetical protein